MCVKEVGFIKKSSHNLQIRVNLICRCYGCNIDKILMT